jgi:glycosyltransferase involved in cell wall biosynthesis
MKVTFCITCYDQDFFLLEDRIKSIEHQTVQPDTISIVCSGLQKEGYKVFEIAKKYNCAVYNSPIRHLAGWARNTGGFICNTDVISFCDVDDSIHPQKCEFIKRVFENKNISALVHNYHTLETWNGRWDFISDFSVEEIVKTEDTPPDPIPAGWFDIPRTNVLTEKKEPVCHGHVTCRKQVFEDGIRYNEEMSLGEDGTFCRAILANKKHNLFYTAQKLILYT